jgi:hypothetical protein
MIYTIYKTEIGQILRIVDVDNIEQQLRLNESYILGTSDDSTQYVENGVLVPIPTKPGNYYVFDWTTKTWIQDYSLASTTVGERRTKLLYGSDWTQIPNGPLTSEKQQEWAIYRQELRDVTSQPGYPYNVVWPTPPTN